MKGNDLVSFEFNGKSYNLLSPKLQYAFYEVGFICFRYYLQDKVIITTDYFIKKFNAQRFYNHVPDSFIGSIFIKSDTKRISAMFERLEKNGEKVSEALGGCDGHIYRLVMVPLDKDENGNILTVAGFIENIEGAVQSDKMIEALSKDYGCIYYVDYERNKVIPQRLSDDIEREYGNELRLYPKYEKIVENYITNTVLNIEQDEMRKICSPENLEKEFKKNDIIVHDYRAVRNGKIIYCRMKAVNLSNSAKLKSFAMAFSDLSKIKSYEIEKLAFVDSLTGSNNYNYFKKQVRDIGIPGYIISMDIHQFKLINSICGVSYGDRVLREIWNTILKHLKTQDTAAHVNADHFVIYSPRTPKEEVISALNNLSDELFKLSVNMRCPRIHPYFGIARWEPGKRIEETYSLTTIAKHEAKKRKDTNYHFYSKEETAKIIEEKSMEDAFPDALANNNFEVWYQPKFDPRNGQMVGAEALVRWRLPSGDLIPPGKFIPVFEQDGLIRTLDEYVFDTVCHFIKGRLRRGLKTLPISVNLSRASLYYEGIVEEYSQIVQDAEIKPEMVPIEITESAAANNSDIKEISNEFRKNGFLLCMDDFGTGYSSLALLNMLHFDNLKLDKSLVDGIGEDSGHKLIKHIIALSKDLGMNITAEGVEYESQKNKLLLLNCDNIQGYFYKPPLPEKEFVNLF